MKKSGSSILGKYSDGSYKKKKKNDLPLMASYEQRYKGNLSKEITEPKKVTLDEKIKAKSAPVVPEKTSFDRVSVEIGGSNYLLGCTEDLSKERIIKIAELADEIYCDTKAINPYIANNKTAILSLIECCDRYLTLKDTVETLKTELMYYKQKDIINSAKETPKELTPMEKLANGELTDEES